MEVTFNVRIKPDATEDAVEKALWALDEVVAVSEARDKEWNFEVSYDLGETETFSDAASKIKESVPGIEAVERREFRGRNDFAD